MADFFDVLSVVLDVYSNESREKNIFEEEAKVKEGPRLGNYDIAVKAIMESDMISSHKSDCVRILDKNATDAYYKAVAAIAKSDMLSSHKCHTIRNLSH